MSKTVTVGIADLNVVDGTDVLVTYALGSCVGICLYDSVLHLAGLAHIMLPASQDMCSDARQNLYKFADTGIQSLIQQMQRRGGVPSRFKAKIAGGAQMFAAISTSSIANIGARNVAAVKKELMQHHIPILAEDTGADYGRTLYFNAADGIMRIKSVKMGEERSL